MNMTIKTLTIACLLALVAGCASMPTGLYQHTPATTNAITGEITPAQINPDPMIDAAIRSVGSLPIPGAAAGAIALGWLYTGFAAMRNKKTAQALIEGVEAGRKILQETPEGKKVDEAIRRNLIEHQQFRGVLEHVAKLVQQYTAETTRP